jgi:hypothetical protein
MFLAGAVQTVLAFVPWVWELLARSGALAGPAWPWPPGWVHGLWAIYGVFPFFVFGFLMTAMPRWQGMADTPGGAARRPWLCLVAGWLLFDAGLVVALPGLLAAGLALVLAGWALAARFLFRWRSSRARPGCIRWRPGAPSAPGRLASWRGSPLRWAATRWRPASACRSACGGCSRRCSWWWGTG